MDIFVHILSGRYLSMTIEKKCALAGFTVYRQNGNLMADIILEYKKRLFRKGIGELGRYSEHIGRG